MLQPPPSHLTRRGSGKPDKCVCVCLSQDGTKGRSESDTCLCCSEKMKSCSFIAQPRWQSHPSCSLCIHLAGSHWLRRGGRQIYQGSHSWAAGAQGDRCAASASSAPSSGKSKSLLIRPRHFLCVSSRGPSTASCAPCSLGNPLSTSNTPLPAVEEATAAPSPALVGDVHQVAGVAGYCFARKKLWRAGSQRELVRRAAREASPVRNSL